MEERRSRSRFEVKHPVTMTTSWGIIEGKIINLSGIGAFIRCRKPLNPGERLHLSVTLPDGSNSELSAEVVWSTAYSRVAKKTPSGMGVRFLW